MPKYHITAERTFTIDYGVDVEADSEEHARVIVEQLNDDLDGWEHKDDCCVKTSSPYECKHIARTQTFRVHYESNVKHYDLQYGTSQT